MTQPSECIEELRDNVVLDSIEDDSIFLKLRKRLSRFTIHDKTKTIIVKVEKSQLGYRWTGNYNHATCIFAKYNGSDEIDPWGKLDILLERKVITQDQRRSFGEAIRNFDNQKGNDNDLKNMIELATILGMEIDVQ